MGCYRTQWSIYIYATKKVQRQTRERERRRRKSEKSKRKKNYRVKENTRCQPRKTQAKGERERERGRKRVKWHLFSSLSYNHELSPPTSYSYSLNTIHCICTFIHTQHKEVEMSCENGSSLWDIKRAIAMCKWVAPSPALSSRGSEWSFFFFRLIL